MNASLARLDVVSGKAVGMSLVVADELVIGRHADPPGRLADDEEISRVHARLTRGANGRCTIEDLGSTNGTFVNGERLSAPRELRLGDTIEVGQTGLVVRELPPASSKSQPSGVLEPTPVTRTDGDAAVDEPPARFGALPSVASLALRLEVDFAGREARLFVHDDSEPVRLVFEGGAWRSVAPPSGDEPA